MRKAVKKGLSQRYKKKSETITFALSKSDLKLVQELAAKNSEGNISAWVRQAALKYRLTK